MGQQCDTAGRDPLHDRRGHRSRCQPHQRLRRRRHWRVGGPDLHGRRAGRLPRTCGGAQVAQRMFVAHRVADRPRRRWRGLRRRCRHRAVDDLPGHRTRQCRPFRIRALQRCRHDHGQRDAGWQFCIELAQQTADGGRAGGRRLIQRREVRRQPMQACARIGTRTCEACIHAGHGDRPWSRVVQARQHRPGQPQREQCEQHEAQQQQRPFVEADTVARFRLLPQPAQRGEIGRHLLIPAREVQQQWHHQRGKRSQAGR